jgi:uncharacterized protein (UPF0276 family)
MPFTSGVGCGSTSDRCRDHPPVRGVVRDPSENFTANRMRPSCRQHRARHVSVHSVGVSVGSASGIDRPHLARVRALVDPDRSDLRIGSPRLVDPRGRVFNDLLPTVRKETLRIVSAHVDEVQDTRAALSGRELVELCGVQH